MDYFRNIVLLAAIVGLIAGLGMTVAQEFTTVPLILQAEVFEQAGEAKAAPAAWGASRQLPATRPAPKVRPVRLDGRGYGAWRAVTASPAAGRRS